MANTNPNWMPEGHVGASNDTILRATQKILGAINDGGGSSSSSGGNSDGVVDPTTAPTSTTVTNYYTNTATRTLWVWPANGSAWTQIV